MEYKIVSYELVLATARAQLVESKPEIFQYKLEFVDLDPMLWLGIDKKEFFTFTKYQSI